MLNHNLLNGALGAYGGRLAAATATAQKLLRKVGLPGALPGGLPGGLPGTVQRPKPSPGLPPGARFLADSFSNEAGTRPYKLYVPSGYRPGQTLPLVVMLHGCTQSPDDFAAGTRMNEAAERQPCLVLYPGQTAAANNQKCWNWFNEEHQRRGQGEPALLAGMVRQVMRDYAVDRRRVYVAGLSAGGATAAIMADSYPELFAAVGVHSGLACGAARNLPGALAAMQGGAPGRPAGDHRLVPAIVFHGDRDRTVNPGNGDAVVAQLSARTALQERTEQGNAPGGHAYHRTTRTDRDGRVVIEQWVVHGGGHAWFGGCPAGSHTDPRGPDATAEMLRFFSAHSMP